MYTFQNVKFLIKYIDKKHPLQKRWVCCGCDINVSMMTQRVEPKRSGLLMQQHRLELGFEYAQQTVCCAGFIQYRPVYSDDLNP